MTTISGPNMAAGSSLSGSVGAANAVLIPKNTYSAWVTIQNTHATQTLNLSFGTATAADFKLAAGASLTIPYGLANDLSGFGSGAATTWAAIGV